MSYIPTPEQALELVKRYNKEQFHVQHAETVGKVMGEIAKTYDPGNEDYWRAVGILHDIDYEQWPEEHCVRAQSLLKELDVDDTDIHAVCSHGYGLVCDVEPTRQMEKFLFAVDEFTGLIWAAAKMRPTGYDGMEVKSVMKKFKDKGFAAGCSRDVIKKGAEMLGIVPQHDGGAAAGNHVLLAVILARLQHRRVHIIFQLVVHIRRKVEHQSLVG